MKILTKVSRGATCNGDDDVGSELHEIGRCAVEVVARPVSVLGRPVVK